MYNYETNREEPESLDELLDFLFGTEEYWFDLDLIPDEYKAYNENMY